jgi:hypothetical protein
MVHSPFAAAGMEHPGEVVGNPQNSQVQFGNRASVATPEEQNSRRGIFFHEAVTRRSKRRLSRIAKGP